MEIVFLARKTRVDKDKYIAFDTVWGLPAKGAPTAAAGSRRSSSYLIHFADQRPARHSPRVKMMITGHAASFHACAHAPSPLCAGDLTFLPNAPNSTTVMLKLEFQLPWLLVDLKVGVPAVETQLRDILSDNLIDFKKLAEALASELAQQQQQQQQPAPPPATAPRAGAGGRRAQQAQQQDQVGTLSASAAAAQGGQQAAAPAAAGGADSTQAQQQQQGPGQAAAAAGDAAGAAPAKRGRAPSRRATPPSPAAVDALSSAPADGGKGAAPGAGKRSATTGASRITSRAEDVRPSSAGAELGCATAAVCSLGRRAGCVQVCAAAAAANVARGAALPAHPEAHQQQAAALPGWTARRSVTGAGGRVTGGPTDSSGRDDAALLKPACPDDQSVAVSRFARFECGPQARRTPSD